MNPQNLIDLSNYRLNRAKDNIQTAKDNIQLGHYKTATNRTYYAIFDTVRALNVLNGVDFKKHSGAIAYFNKTFVKEGHIDKSASEIITSASKIRENADYKDFFLVSKQDAEKQLEKALLFISIMEPFIKKTMLEMAPDKNKIIKQEPKSTSKGRKL